MRITHCVFVLTLSLLCGAALAAGKSYMALVGELFGAVETPRIVLDVCASRSPATADSNARLYAGWRERHRALLDAIDEQISRANVRLKKQAAAGSEHSLQDAVTAIRGVLEHQVDGMSEPEVREFCGRYPDLIKKKDAEASTSIQELLNVVAHADEVLSEREKT
jgi:hypothetical protein